MLPRRVDALDVLRGFALLGILLANAQLMAGPQAAPGPDAPGYERVAAWAVAALVTTKFYVLFSFLFGYSFVLQARSAEWDGAAHGPRHLRRATALFGLGLVHAVLLFPGDILMTYAALALVLYGLRGLSPRAALRLAACLLVVLAALMLAYGLLTVAVTEPLGAARRTAEQAEAVAAYRGGFRSVVGAHLSGIPGAIGAALLHAPAILAAMLAGLAAAKSALAERRGRDRVWLRGVVVRLLPAGLAGGAVAACCMAGPLDSRWFLVGLAVSVVTTPVLTASYACGLLLLLELCRPAAARVLAAAGRLALSHYLAQSLVLSFVFTGYGFALYDRAGTLAVLAGCVVLYAVQLAAGALLRRHLRYGPAEFVLRTVTWARRPAARRLRPVSTGARPAAPESPSPPSRP